MATVTETSGVTPTAAPPVTPQTDKTTTASATAAADFKNFLTLLTAQLRHQDPLSPLDSTQFVEQLASFSAVEQQIETNKLLRELMGDTTKSNFENAAVWIGKEILTETPEATFEGEPLEFRAPAGPDGAAREVVVRNASGDTVYTETLAAGQTEFTWNGQDVDGFQVSDGAYKFSVEFTKDGEAAGSKPLFAASRVVEVRFQNDELKLGLENGAVITPEDVTALREAPKSDVLPGNV
jgi:flagellar basal-body rod modification protein FlgD